MKVEEVYFQNLDEIITFHIGKSKEDNFRIIDIANPEDLWFHAKDTPSCHVIALMPENNDYTKKELMSIIKHGAMLCKENTTKINNLSNVEFLYTKIKNVVKTKVVGCVDICNTKTIVV
jgi:predicted ribosome quality control (RQC) complex YloA/Tae2 family protein